MKLFLTIPILFAAVAAARSLPEAAPAPLAEEQTWTPDPVHSSVVFRVKHANATWFYGVFEKVSGEIVYDPKKPQATKVKIQIAADSVNTRNEKRDNHVKGPDFFDAKQYPMITFTSSKVVAAKEKDTLEVTGDLEMHGIKKSITLKVEKTGEGDFHGPRIGWEAAPTVKRSDFKMDYGIAQNALGDEVTLKISLECMKKAKG